MAKVFDKEITFNKPQLETEMVLKTYNIKDDSFQLHIGKYGIILTKKEKEDLVKEWDLMEKLNNEWKSKNINDLDDSKYIKFLDKAHNDA